MIEGRGAESHDCADVIALEREAGAVAGCALTGWRLLGRYLRLKGLIGRPLGIYLRFRGLPKRDTRSIAGEMPLGSCGLRCVYTLAPTP